ncbi:MAG: sensor histidine kinase [Trueperaceae bacterium]|nr:MAG: sensor histidine kinase [Trueperaceae bacterium]
MRSWLKKTDWKPYLSLIYLGFLGIQPIYDPDFGSRETLATLAMVAAFVPVFFWGSRQVNHRLLWAVTAMTLLGVVGMGFTLNTGATVFFVYAAATAAQSEEPRRAWAVEGLILTAAVGAFFMSEVPYPFRWAVFAPAFGFIPIIGSLQIFEAERSRSDAKLRLAQEEIERLATIAERERIARDLHDLLGHTLSVITLKSELAAKLVPKNPERATREMIEVEQLSRKTLSQVRTAIRGYRAHGLAGEIASAKVALEAADIVLSIKAEPVDLTPKQEGALALVLREGVTNILRHSGASHTEMFLGKEGDQIRLSLADNGSGGGTDGSGLKGIRERVRALGGHVERSVDGGTTLRVTMPAPTPKEISDKDPEVFQTAGEAHTR